MKKLTKAQIKKEEKELRKAINSIKFNTPSKMFVVGLKATKNRPALWIDVQDTQKFNEYMKDKVGKEIIFITDKEANHIEKSVEILLKTIENTKVLSLKDWIVLRNKLKKA